MTLYHSLLPRLTAPSGLFVSFSPHPLPSSLHFSERSFFLGLSPFRAALWTAASRRLLICTVRTPSSECVRVQTHKTVCVSAAPHAPRGSRDGQMDGWMDRWTDSEEVDVCVSCCDGRNLPSSLTLITYLTSHRPAVRDAAVFLVPPVMCVWAVINTRSYASLAFLC